MFLSPTRVVFESLNRKDAAWATVRASTTSYMAVKQGRAPKVLELDAALSLRDLNEFNLWHLIDDVFPKLLLAEEAGIPSDVPAVIGERLTHLRCFPEVEAVLSRFRPLIVQDRDVHVSARALYCGVVLKNNPKWFDRFLDVYERELTRNGDAHAEVGTVPAPPSAVFVTRAPRRARSVVNADEVLEVCRSRALDVIDFDTMSFAEARERMLAAETIIGYHGAGLTNTMFRRGHPTRIGEILMDGHVAAEYYMLARHWGFAYRAMLGRIVERKGYWSTYRVDCTELARLIDDVLAMPPTARTISDYQARDDRDSDPMTSS